MTITPTWCHFQIFWRCFVSLVNFSYLSKCHIRIITGSWVMTVLILWGIKKKSKSQVGPALVLPNIWRLGQVRDTKFGTNVSNKILLNAAKQQGYSFYYFWVSKGKSISFVALLILISMLVKGTYFYRSHWYVFISYVKKTDNHNNKSNFFCWFSNTRQ